MVGGAVIISLTVFNGLIISRRSVVILFDLYGGEIHIADAAVASSTSRNSLRY
jgi:hypothetical protein